jgi:hypothetical protein
MYWRQVLDVLIERPQDALHASDQDLVLEGFFHSGRQQRREVAETAEDHNAIVFWHWMAAPYDVCKQRVANDWQYNSSRRNIARRNFIRDHANKPSVFQYRETEGSFGCDCGLVVPLLSCWNCQEQLPECLWCWQQEREELENRTFRRYCRSVLDDYDHDEDKLCTLCYNNR